jgi:16S rRNA (cytidine1402-2'-O)-methyltransferase
MTHTLYVVGTPIGNLEDISPRALRILGEVSCIASENPARTRRLLARYQIRTPMIRYTDAYQRKKVERLQGVLDALDRGDVALVSEAGMPLIADPGYELVQAVLEKGIPVIPVPGPTAATAALAVSGIPPTPCCLLGFPPRRPAARRALFRPFSHDTRTLVLYESPKRLADTLEDALAVLGDRQVAVSCELTKLYESTWRGTLGAAVARFRETPQRGEFVVVIGGAAQERQADAD